MPNDWKGPDMVFLVGGYDEGEAYGRIFEVKIPREPDPNEWNAGDDEFGIVWGGQQEVTGRLIHGYDPRLPGLLKEFLQVPEKQFQGLMSQVAQGLSISIPYQFLPLQDCVDLAIFLVRTTATLQNFQVGVRGVGGAIDVATVTRTEGFRPVQQKSITGEHQA